MDNNRLRESPKIEQTIEIKAKGLPWDEMKKHIKTAIESEECPPGNSQCQEPFVYGESCRECWIQHFVDHPPSEECDG